LHIQERKRDLLALAGIFSYVIPVKYPTLLTRFAKVQITYGPSTWAFSRQTSEFGDQLTTYIQECNLDGTTKAVCGMTYSYDTSGSKSASTIITTLSDRQVPFGPVAITSGALKLSNTASCTSTSSAAAATAVSEIYKLMIAPGAAALLMGL
jgi:hypothetical protein